MKIVTFIGTRPELIKMSEFLRKADSIFEHTLIHTGQNYSSNLSDIFFEDLNLRRPDHWLDVASDGADMTLGNIINKSYAILKEIRPDAILVYGDTHSCLSAISAKRLGITVFHIEAGNRSFDKHLPEEMNRKIVDHISDINICLSANAKQYLIGEGMRGDKVFNIGSPMKEIFMRYSENYSKGKFRGFSDEKEFILLTLHRDYLMNNPVLLNDIIQEIVDVSDSRELNVIMTAHPRAISLIKVERNNFKVIPAVGYKEFVDLMLSARLICSDSGTITEESHSYGVEALSIRNSHERPEGLEGGQIVHSGYDPKTIGWTLSVLLDNDFSKGHTLDYEVSNWSDKLIKIILTELCTRF
jgi:UDP-N-acetyl-L-fucosamine synthase